MFGSALYSLYFTNVTDDTCRETYNALLTELASKIDELAEANSQQLAGEAPPQAATSLRATESPGATELPGAEFSDIPLYPQQADYEAINHWFPTDYRAIRHGKKDPATQISDSKLCLFWELPDGTVVPSNRRKAVTNDLRAWWQEKHDDEEHLTSIRDLGWRLRDSYRAHIEGKYPWLRLCADHWKADMLWQNHFSSWSPAKAPTDGEESTSTKREHSPEDTMEGPSSKKLKSAGATLGPVVPKSRPRPTKTNARIVKKVPSTSSSTRAITQHTHSLPHCS